MYDLAVPRDVREVENLGNPKVRVSEEVAAERERLHQKLIHVMETLGTFPHEIEWPKHWGSSGTSRGTEPGPDGRAPAASRSSPALELYRVFLGSLLLFREYTAYSSKFAVFT